MTIDLGPIDQQIEALMIDEVRIYREARDSDRVLNEETLKYEAAPDVTLYEGKAMISTDSQEPRDREYGGKVSDETLYKLRIPKDPEIPRIRHGDKVFVISSKNSPALEQLTLRVEQEIHGTYAVGRKFHIALVDRVID